MWHVLAVIAAWWPSRLSGVLDGPPLDTIPEALILGLVIPVLVWAHPAFFNRIVPRLIVCLILLVKIGGTFTLQQQGLCLTFAPPKPMVRESTGKPHAWDMRADWLADDPVCSAVMTRSYRDTRELPVWFYNLAPPDDAPHRGGYGFGEIHVRETLFGFLDVPDNGTFQLLTGPATNATLRIDNRVIEPVEPGRHEAALARGTHIVQLDAVLLSKHWPIVPTWNGIEMGSMRFPATTLGPPTWRDRLARPYLNWLLAVLLAALIAWWSTSFVLRVRDGALVVWAAAASAAVALAAIYLPMQAPWYTAAVLALSSLIAFRARYRNLFGAFMLVGVPWLAYTAAANVYQIGRWTLYGEGNDNFLFQRYSYRVFMQHYWLEGGQVTFWNQPLIRWIVGAQHMVFGESSVGQVYWDAFGVTAMALFAYRVVAVFAGFTAGLVAAVIPFAIFLLGPTLEFVGFGLSEISSASFIYVAAFFAMRNRGWKDAAIAGVLLILAFYTRLNNLPMALAVAAFALPITTPAGIWWRPRVWWPQVRWRIVFGVVVSLGIGAVLFAWRTWYYAGVFSVFHGTQRQFLAVWKPHMTASEAVPAMISSVMMVITASDPPALVWHSAPLVAAAVIAVLAVLNVPGFRGAPLPVVLLFLAGCAGALVTRGWGHEGRFSIHLFGTAAALCGWAGSAFVASLRSRVLWYAPQRSSREQIAS
jgi:hypothetical protein